MLQTICGVGGGLQWSNDAHAGGVRGAFVLFNVFEDPGAMIDTLCQPVSVQKVPTVQRTACDMPGVNPKAAWGGTGTCEWGAGIPSLLRTCMAMEPNTQNVK